MRRLKIRTTERGNEEDESSNNYEDTNMKIQDHPMSQWHTKFIWMFPIRVNGEFIWFKNVWRIAHEASWDGDGGWIWWYLPIETDMTALQVRAKLEDNANYCYGYPNWILGVPE